jgi:hypothetical protein
MKLSTAIKAKMYNRGIANLNVQGIKTTADLDTWKFPVSNAQSAT